MPVSRSRLIAVAVLLLAIGGAALAAGSFASGRHPASAHRTAALAQRTFVSAATGNDANPCNRTAPCRNFAAAIAQTQPGGEVIVLDSGGYGTVTITQAVSLVAPPGVYAGITVFGGNGITINAGSTDIVTIRGLTLNAIGGSEGIEFNSGAELHVEDTVFRNFINEGIFANPATDARVLIDDSLFTGDRNGVFLESAAATIQGTIEHTRFENGFNDGVTAYIHSNVVVRDSVATGNGGAGFLVDSTRAQLDVENSLTTHNHWGLYSLDSANLRVSETTIEENTIGVAEFNGGTVTSFGNNRLAGNGTNGSFTSTIPLQ